MKNHGVFLEGEKEELIELIEQTISNHRVSTTSLKEWLPIIAKLADNGYDPDFIIAGVQKLSAVDRLFASDD